MDSVLTYLVEDSSGVISELQKILRNILNKSSVELFRDSELCLRVLLESLEPQDGEEIILSSLAPYNIYNAVLQNGFTPVIVDVSQDTAGFDINQLEKSISERTRFIINTSVYTYNSDTKRIKELGVGVIDIILSGIPGNNRGDIVDLYGDYTIISLETTSIANSLGGALIAFDRENLEFNKIISEREELILSGINAAFALSHFQDLTEFFKKRNPVLEIYKNSIQKSGFTTFDNEETNSYSYFPVLIDKAIKEKISYCKSQGLDTLRGYTTSISKKIPDLKSPNGRSLSARTLLVPIPVIMKKESMELISRILSTLP